jgi:hypothetical protein
LATEAMIESIFFSSSGSGRARGDRAADDLQDPLASLSLEGQARRASDLVSSEAQEFNASDSWARRELT